MAEYDATPGPTRVAAIDFGTGFCSLAYTIAEDAAPDKIINVQLSCSVNAARVPTAILLLKNPDESNLKVAKFGSEAQDEIIKMSREDLEKHLYFECFKMNLFHEAEVGRNMCIEALNGKSYYLVEVIAFVLWYLKWKFVRHLSRIGASVDDFDWVITVPAIWKASGKQLMREAAYLAGLLSNAKGISSFTPCDDESLCMKFPNEKNSHKLTLALEPECAALYCQQLTNDLIAPYCHLPDSLSADSYMVCDLGAGTVDITAQVKHGEDDIEVVIPPTGNDSGGKKINQQFYHLLEEIIGDTGFQSFLSSDKKEKKRIDRQVIITNIVFNEFEKLKQQFGMEVSDLDLSEDSAFLIVSLPEKFVRFYTKEKIIEGIKDHRIVFVKTMCTLKIKYTKVKELFEPVVQRAIECIKKALVREEIKKRIKMIYLVGGFGGCMYTYSALRKVIPSDIQVVVPEQHTLAVSRGAVLYRRCPAIIKARRMDAFYGIRSIFPFNARVHDKAYAYSDPDTGEKKCKNVFFVFVKKGQKVTLNDPVVKTVIPYSQASVAVDVPFYTTTDHNLLYTEDKQGRHIAKKIGSLTLDCPNPDKLDTKDREIEVTMDFSSTEIKVQARALYLPGQPPVKAVLDFL